jgi:hypothetical protein
LDVQLFYRDESVVANKSRARLMKVLGPRSRNFLMAARNESARLASSVRTWLLACQCALRQP